MSRNQSPAFSRPQATAACRLGGVVKVRNWWVRANAWVNAGQAARKPTFPPVRPNLLPPGADLPGPVAHAGLGVNRRGGRIAKPPLLPDLIADGDHVVATQN